MGFICSANLPSAKVTQIVAGKSAESFKNELLCYGVNILACNKNAFSDDLLAFHADLSVCYAGNGTFFIESNQSDIINLLQNQGAKCILIPDVLSNDYPGNSLLNCVFTDNCLICNTKTVSKKILDYAEEHKISIISVKQGYAKCSVCIVSNDAFITDDISIFNSLKESKKDVLLVEKGSVELSGYNYGFIGGCSGKISNIQIAFCGDIKSHKNYNNIKSFTANYNCELISLSNGRLQDVGSLIPVTEKEDE